MMGLVSKQIRAGILTHDGWLWLEFALLNNTTVVLKGQTHLIQPRHFKRSTSGGSTFGSLSSDVDSRRWKARAARPSARTTLWPSNYQSICPETLR